MNKIYNTWIFIISLLTLPFAFAVGLNEVFGIFGMKIHGDQFEYKNLVFGLSGGLIFVIGAMRSSRKWSGIKIVNQLDRKSTRLNSSHVRISYAVFCLKKKKKTKHNTH